MCFLWHLLDVLSKFEFFQRRTLIYLFIYLIHYLISITRSYKTNLHQASMKYDTLT